MNIQARSDINKLSVSPDSKIMIAVDIEGYALIINLLTQKIISHFNFKSKLTDIKFSPNNKFLAICSNLSFKIYEAPQLMRNFEAIVLYKKFKGCHAEQINGIEWSPDSRFLVTFSKDLTA